MLSKLLSNRLSHRPAVMSAIVAAIVTVAVPMSSASAGPVGDLSPEAAVALAEQLGPRSAGAYLDKGSGRMVVTVTDAAAMGQVRAAGAEPKLAARGAAELAAVTAALDAEARVPGTAWHVDPVSNQVVVAVDPTVTGARLDRVTAVTKRFGDGVRISSMPDELTFLNPAGGDEIRGGGHMCSLGFNVRQGPFPYFLTAGHCTDFASIWARQDNRQIGVRHDSSFPGNDYGIVEYRLGMEGPGAVNLYNGDLQVITRARDVVVGQTDMKRSGRTTGLHEGEILAVNVTINVRDPQTGATVTVRELIKTNICAERGDSGGPLFKGQTAHGLTSAGSGDCSDGGETYFQPILEVMEQYDLDLG